MQTPLHPVIYYYNTKGPVCDFNVKQAESVRRSIIKHNKKAKVIYEKKTKVYRKTEE